MIVECKKCKQKFEDRKFPRQSRFCSSACNRNITGKIYECANINCKKPTYRSRCKMNNKSGEYFCSRKCAIKRKEIICSICNVKFHVSNAKFKTFKNLYCSNKCRYVGRSKHMSGQFATTWAGGVCKNSNGYILEMNKEHPHASKSGYVLQHRLVMEKQIGRLLRSNEIVHHRNGLRHDNRPENLELWCVPSQTIGQRVSDLVKFVVDNYWDDMVKHNELREKQTSEPSLTA